MEMGPKGLGGNQGKDKENNDHTLTFSFLSVHSFSPAPCSLVYLSR